jgi:hypothetical protein
MDITFKHGMTRNDLQDREVLLTFSRIGRCYSLQDISTEGEVLNEIATISLETKFILNTARFLADNYEGGSEYLNYRHWGVIGYFSQVKWEEYEDFEKGCNEVYYEGMYTFEWSVVGGGSLGQAKEARFSNGKILVL